MYAYIDMFKYVNININIYTRPLIGRVISNTLKGGGPLLDQLKNGVKLFPWAI